MSDTRPASSARRGVDWSNVLGGTLCSLLAATATGAAFMVLDTRHDAGKNSQALADAKESRDRMVGQRDREIDTINRRIEAIEATLRSCKR